MKHNNIKCLFGHHDWKQLIITDPDNFTPSTESMTVNVCKVCGHRGKPITYTITPPKFISIDINI